MGLAFAPSIDGPWTRNGTITDLPALPGEDPFGCAVCLHVRTLYILPACFLRMHSLVG